MKIVGLTGGIATGKSTVAGLLGENGLPVVDADAVAHELLLPGGANFEPVVREFGREILASDGTIDRKALGRIVFADQERLRRLEELTHPAIREKLREELAGLAANGRDCAVLDHPLLFEISMEVLADEVWVVACNPETQRQRLIKRDGLSPEAVEQRLAAQWPLEEKVRRADVVVFNDGSLGELRLTVQRVLKEREICGQG